MNLLTFRIRQRIAAAVALFLLPACAGCKQGPWTLWQSYAARFIDQQGRVIDPMGNRTTSEGQSYALFFALVSNDRPHFNKVLEWTQFNLSHGDFQYHLPAWLWGRDKDGTWKALDENSASDADTWLAYTLIEAGRLWNQPGYTKMGRDLMAQIAAREVVELPGFGPMLAPGPVGFEHSGSWTLNPSYLPVFLFERLGQVDPQGPWLKIAAGVPRMIRESSRKGYAMDWVNYVPGDGFFPAPQFPDPSAAPAAGSYDAIRVYMWAGMLDAKDTARAEMLDALPGMKVYLADHDAPPEKISDQGIPSGQDGMVGFSAAVMPYLRAVSGGGKALFRQSARVRAERDPKTGMYGKDLTYYDQNLALFSTGFMDKRFSFSPDGELAVGWSQT